MDKDFSSGSLTGCVLLASPYWALCCEHAERFAPHRPTRLAIGPEVCLLPAGQRESLADTADPPTSAALRLPAHPTLERSVGISRTPPRRGQTCPRSAWPPASARGARQPDTRLATIPADQLADKHGRDRPARV
jgi:hypothetical protein